MKKCIRGITINNQIYTWGLGKNNCDGDGSNLITIWENRNKIHDKIISGHIQITPSLVRKLIEEYIADSAEIGKAH